MQVTVQEELDQVVLRHSTADLALRGGALFVLGIGVPAWVQTTVPSLVVPALVVTAGVALWAVTAVTAVLILDDLGVTVSAARRARGRVPWDRVASITLDGVHVVVRTTEGARLHGPPTTAATLDEALKAASDLDLLPAHLRPDAPGR